MIRNSASIDDIDLPGPHDALDLILWRLAAVGNTGTFRVERLSLRLWLIGVDLIRAAAGDASDDDGRRLERERLADGAVRTAITLDVLAPGEGDVDQPDNRGGG
jgi:hypothetical protein